MKLYHATTQKKAKLYRETGHICKPVRGFTTLQGAMAWAMTFLFSLQVSQSILSS